MSAVGARRQAIERGDDQQPSIRPIAPVPTPASVPGSLPVLFFGDLFTAQAATVGLNPSKLEYLSKYGLELDGAQRRFETLRSLDAADRTSLSAEQCERAIQRMQRYFQPGKPVHVWFHSLDRVLNGMKLRIQAGEVAHLDLVQEATDPTWAALIKQDPARWRRSALRMRRFSAGNWTRSQSIRSSVMAGQSMTRSAGSCT